MKTEKCVICKKAKDDVGHYGDTGICVCLKCYKEISLECILTREV